MKKWIKNLVLILAVVFSIGSTNAQKNTIIGDGSYNVWIVSNPTCYGCGSFYSMVVNIQQPSNGFYYYDIYFWSNSYYTNGYTSNTYIKQINIYALDQSGKNTLVLTFPYVVVHPKSELFNGYFYVGYVYSTNSMQKINITWSSASSW